MMIWYYEYRLLWWNEVDQLEETRCGVVPAKNFMEAMKLLEKDYGKDEIVEIQRLKPILEGTVFDFKEANESEDCNFSVDCY